jgi:basic amino acid/polyamine antiporter, APA family
LTEAQHTERSIGLWGAVMTFVGLIIGASIYILPGQLAATAGPSVILAYLLGGVMAFFTCILAAQIGSVITRSGGGFHAITTLISPMVGFVCMWLVLVAVVLVSALVALGFADYLRVYFPQLNQLPVALSLVGLFCIINIVGTRASIISQSAMTVVFLLAMAVFIAAALLEVELTNLIPFMPAGLDGMMMAVVPAYIAWTGVTVLIEIGGEIKDPAKNVPRALMIGFIIVVVFYISVCIALVGVVPWDTLGQYDAPVVAVAERVLPGWVVNFITLSALLASATSLNSLMLAYPRDVYAMSRQGLFPALLGKLSGVHAVPANAVIVVSIFIAMAIMMGGAITDYASMAVMAILLVQVVLAVAVTRIPRVMPEQYSVSSFRLSGTTIRVSAVVVTLSSLGLVIGAAIDDPAKGLFLVGLTVVGSAYYALRVRYLARSRV